MKRSSFWKMPAVAAAFALALALVMTGCPTEVTPDTAWQVSADSDTNTTALHFTFNRAVNLEYADIELFGGVSPALDAEGDVRFYGGGRTWVLPILVGGDGEVRVTINRAGIARASQTVRVSNGGAVTWTAVSNFEDDADDRISTTALRFEFAEPQYNLSRSNFAILNSTGEVEVGAALIATATARVWYLPVTVLRDGDVQVFANIQGVSALPNGGDNGNGNGNANVAVDFVNWTAGFSPIDNVIELEFDLPVDLNLAGTTVSVIAVDGMITTGALAGAGRSWTLPVATIVREGDVWVFIDGPGIAPEPHSEETAGGGSDTPVNLGLISWNVDISECLSYLEFDFYLEGNSPIPITGLTAGHINIAAVTGIATLGDAPAPHSGGAEWFFPVTVTRAGDVLVTINRAGFERYQTSGDDVTVSSPEGIDWAVADCDADVTTEIVFEFEEPVNLAAEGVSVNVYNHTGVVVPGDLSGSGMLWFLEIETIVSGDVYVSITGLDTIANAGVRIRVEVAADDDEYDDIEWEAVAGEGEPTPYIVLTFSEPVAGLTVGPTGMVSFIDTGDGRVTGAGAPVPSLGGKRWTVPITVVIPGAVSVSVNIPRIEIQVEEVTVYGPPAVEPVEWEPEVMNDDQDNTRYINLRFEAPVSLAPEDIRFIPGDVTVIPRAGATAPFTFTASSGGMLWSIPVSVVLTGGGTEVPAMGSAHLVIVRAGICYEEAILENLGGNIVREEVNTISSVEYVNGRILMVFEENQTTAPSNAITVSVGGTVVDPPHGIALGAPVGGGRMWSFLLTITPANFPTAWVEALEDDYSIEVTLGFAAGVYPGGFAFTIYPDNTTSLGQ